MNQEMSLRYRNLPGAAAASGAAALNGIAIFDSTMGGGGVMADGGFAQQMSMDDRRSSGSAFSSPAGTAASCSMVSVEDLNEISRTTLLLMVEWAKGMQPFPELSMEDKVNFGCFKNSKNAFYQL